MEALLPRHSLYPLHDELSGIYRELMRGESVCLAYIPAPVLFVHPRNTAQVALYDKAVFRIFVPFTEGFR